MKNKIATMFLLGIMTLCTAATCTADDDEIMIESGKNALKISDTTWETTGIQVENLWRTPEESGKALHISFRHETYQARYDTHKFDYWGHPTSKEAAYFGGNYQARGHHIYCYDAGSNSERLRFEVLRRSSNEIEANVFLPTREESFHAILTLVPQQ